MTIQERTWTGQDTKVRYIKVNYASLSLYQYFNRKLKKFKQSERQTERREEERVIAKFKNTVRLD